MPILPFTEEVSYEEYCAALASIEGQAIALSLPGPLMKWVSEAKETFDDIAEMAKVSLAELLTVFRHRDLFGLLKAVGFSLKKILLALRKAGSLISRGLLSVMEEVSKSDLVEKLRSGAVTIDVFLNKYPMLKQLAGVGLAGLLLYMWLNMSFIGDFEYDMDMGTIIDALKGNFTIADLFLSPDGLANVALFAIGSFTGLSFVWLASSTASFVVALLYTAAVRLNKSGLKQKLKPLLELKRISV